MPVFRSKYQGFGWGKLGSQIKGRGLMIGGQSFGITRIVVGYSKFDSSNPISLLFPVLSGTRSGDLVDSGLGNESMGGENDPIV
jgi:hypothetical protein